MSAEALRLVFTGTKKPKIGTRFWPSFIRSSQPLNWSQTSSTAPVPGKSKKIPSLSICLHRSCHRKQSQCQTSVNGYCLHKYIVCTESRVVKCSMMMYYFEEPLYYVSSLGVLFSLQCQTVLLPLINSSFVYQRHDFNSPNLK